MIQKKIRRILAIVRGDQHLPKFIHRGLKMGRDCTVMSGVIIDPSHCYHITMGDRVTLAPRVHILAHDASTWHFLGKTRAANVTIGNDVFIGVSSIVLPGVSIGDRVVIGAGSVVTKDIPSNSVAVGNPAHVICTLDAYIEKIRMRMNEENCLKGLDPDVDVAGREHYVEMAAKYGEIFVC